MTDFSGSGAYISWDGTAISTDYRELTSSEEIELYDASAGADVAKTYVTGLEDGNVQLTILAQTGGTAATNPWLLMDKGALGTLEWGVEGTADGAPKETVAAIVMSRERTVPYNDLVVMTFSIQFNGVKADGSWSSGT